MLTNISSLILTAGQRFVEILTQKILLLDTQYEKKTLRLLKS